MAKKDNILKRLFSSLKNRFKAAKSLNDLTFKVQKILHPKYPTKLNFDEIKKKLKEGTFDPKSIRKTKR